MQLASNAYDVADTHAAQELYHANGWTDGLPIVPPTEDAVRACLDWVMMPPDQLIGIDIDAALVARAKQRAAAEGLAVDLRVGDISRLDLADESVDLIFCHQTFHHLVDQERALAEFRRVLRPDGLLEEAAINS